MPTKPVKPGDEVDSYCTKCRMDLMHRIIAAAQWQDHPCRVPNLQRTSQLPAAEERGGRATRGEALGEELATRAAPRAGVRKAAAAEVERQREQTWEKAVLGQPISSFKSYRATQTFSSASSFGTENLAMGTSCV